MHPLPAQSLSRRACRLNADAVTAVAGANIALIKYWGKRDRVLNLPTTGSLSITLDALQTQTRVCHDPQLSEDVLVINGQSADAGRVSACLNWLRQAAQDPRPIRVDSHNNFPTAAGLASSASAFAALVVAADQLLGLHASASQLSAWARQGSGSAARSICGGFAVWAHGQRDDGRDSVASPLLAPEAWPLQVLIAVVDEGPKAVASTAGMLHTQASSPLYQAWVEDQSASLRAATQAVQAQDFEALASATEASTLGMHATAMAARPGVLYWQAPTVACVHAIRGLRQRGVAVFFTIDAGPQVKAICLPEHADEVAATLAAVSGVRQVLRSGLGAGARVMA